MPKRDWVGDKGQVSRWHIQLFGKCALARWHRDNLTLSTQIVTPAATGRTSATNNQRIDRHALRVPRPIADDHATGFMAQYQGGWTALVMTKIGMHVRATNAGMGDVNQQVTAILGNGRRPVFQPHLMGCNIGKCSHSGLPSVGAYPKPFLFAGCLCPTGKFITPAASINT